MRPLIGIASLSHINHIHIMHQLQYIGFISLKGNENLKTFRNNLNAESFGFSKALQQSFTVVSYTYNLTEVIFIYLLLLSLSKAFTCFHYIFSFDAKILLVYIILNSIA